YFTLPPATPTISANLFFLNIHHHPNITPKPSSAASDWYKRQIIKFIKFLYRVFSYINKGHAIHQEA
ncbi:hypothetical protein, partial [Escherichia coli]|uniref:hypothetical protein n=1 Tax=Escherichia coli TaxID=562 RepID=UPI00197A878D